MFVELVLAGVSLISPWDDPLGSIIGTGVAGDHAENVSARQARLNQPFDAVFDASGNLLFSDTGNHKIRRVDAKTGIITTIAGSGKAGFSGDGGLATKAQLNEPYGLAINGNDLYFADRLNRRVRVIHLDSGLIESIAGTGASQSSGDGGPAARASLVEPNGVAHDGKHTLYIADVAAHRIRAVNLLDGKIVTLAGDGVAEHDGDGGPAQKASIFGARAVEVDSKGNVYIVEREGNAVRAIDPRTGLITTIAGKGSLGYSGDGREAKDATFRGPKEMAVTAAGEVYVVDTENHAVRHIDPVTRTITTIAGSGARGSGANELDRPHGVAAAPDGSIWVVDTGNHRLVRVKPKHAK